MAYTGTFLGFSESGLRTATAITLVSGVVGVVGAVALAIGNLRSADDDASLPELLVG